MGAAVEILAMRVACSGYRVPDGTGKGTRAELPTGTTGLGRDEGPPLEPTERGELATTGLYRARFSLNLATGSGHERLLS